MTQNPSLSQQETDEINLNIRGVSLRNRLLYLILPTVIGTLTLSGFLGYRFLVREQAQQLIKRKLIDRVELARETIEQKLVEATKITQLIAANSDTLDAVMDNQKIVRESNLNQLSNAELEEKFADTKLLKPDRKLNEDLKRIAKISGLEEIFYTDRNGYNIAYSNPTSDFVQSDELWWEKGKNETQWLSSPEFDKSANTIGFDLVQAIKHPKTGEFLGVIKALLPETYFNVVADNLSYLNIEKSQAIQVIDPIQKIVIQTITSEGLVNDAQIIGKADFSEIVALIVSNQSNLEKLTTRLKNEYDLKDINIDIYDIEKNIVISSFTYQGRYYTLIPIVNQDLVVISSIDTLELKTAGRELIPIILPLALTLIISLTIVIIFVANNLSQPLVELAVTAQEAAVGNLDVIAKSQGTLETKTLANSFNNLIYQVNKLLAYQEQETRQSRKIQDLILKINELQNSESIIELVLQEILSILSIDRAIYYQFNNQETGKIIGESSTNDYSSALELDIYTQDWIQEYLQKDLQNQVQAINNIQEADLSREQLEKLEALAVKSSITAPIFLQGEMIGLLSIHQCSNARSWQPQEITSVEQIANQLSFSLDRLEFLKEQKNAEIKAKQDREKIQWRALELLQEVDPLSQGDLTIRARVTEDEIGTIADSYNATISSLHKLVNQVKIVAKEVKNTADNSKYIVAKLAEESVEQAVSISETVNYIKEMDESIRSVSERASQAREIVRQAAESINVGDDAMNQTVLKINSLQKTVSATEEKVKRLGQSSQEISQVLSSISSFAAQTHLLALKASIEAARAGQKGKGFAVIADEVRSLATQSATATADIENFLIKMQLETTEVVEAMANGTKQVAEGTQLVQHTRQSLDSVTAASNEIRKLVTEIAESAILQSKTSNLVSNNITNVAMTAEENSQSATQVSDEITQLLTVTEKLRTEIDQFKT